MSFYAVSLINLMSLKELDPIGALLFPADILGPSIMPEKRRLGTESVMLTCAQERAEAIIELIRGKYSKRQFMIFRSKTGNGGWGRV